MPNVKIDVQTHLHGEADIKELLRALFRKATKSGAIPESVTKLCVYREELGRPFARSAGNAVDLPRVLFLRALNQSGDALEHFIMRVDKASHTRSDATRWRRALGQHPVLKHSQIVLPLLSTFSRRIPPSPGTPLGASLYPDLQSAYQSLQDHPVQNSFSYLESACLAAVKTGTPTPDSINRVVRNVFAELHMLFYGAASCQDSAQAWLKQKIKNASCAMKKRWDQDSAKKTRAFLALLLSDDVYRDPIPSCLDRVEFPKMRVGFAHGDLHGRNIFVGLRDGEAHAPRLFDFEDMDKENVIAWDFVKLEMELKIRVVEQLVDDDVASAFLRRCVPRSDRPTPQPSAMFGDPAQHQRLECFAGFERLIHIRHEEQARGGGLIVRESALVALNASLPSPIESIYRAVDLFVAIREAAHTVLGTHWKRELAICRWAYSLSSAQFENYSDDNHCMSLISGGMALATAERQHPNPPLQISSESWIGVLSAGGNRFHALVGILAASGDWVPLAVLKAVLGDSFSSTNELALALETLEDFDIVRSNAEQTVGAMPEYMLVRECAAHDMKSDWHEAWRKWLEGMPRDTAASAENDYWIARAYRHLKSARACSESDPSQPLTPEEDAAVCKLLTNATYLREKCQRGMIHALCSELEEASQEPSSGPLVSALAEAIGRHVSFLESHPSELWHCILPFLTRLGGAYNDETPNQQGFSLG
jgi:hypothetical protein